MRFLYAVVRRFVLCFCLEYNPYSENTTPNCIKNISFLASLVVRLFYERKINQYVIIRVCSLSDDVTVRLM